jgi:hypothetical protein
MLRVFNDQKEFGNTRRARSVMRAGTHKENAMRKLVITVAAIAAAAIFAPTASMAQIAVDTPVGGVRIGEPGYHRYHRDYDGPVVRERRIYRERDVGLRGDCRTVTIQRDDGSVKRIRRCD